MAASPDDFISRAAFLKMLEIAFGITPDNKMLKSTVGSLRFPSMIFTIQRAIGYLPKDG